MILDFNPASLYGVEVKRLQEAVRRNIKRFPIDFLFILTTKESNNLRSQCCHRYLILNGQFRLTLLL
ncbi:MAG: ORF6N domain-containing protein [Deltaproteobacteria bacterium]